LKGGVAPKEAVISQASRTNARTVDFPELFSPTKTVKGANGTSCREEKQRTFSKKTRFIVSAFTAAAVLGELSMEG